jgi:hypothetical protein
MAMQKVLCNHCHWHGLFTEILSAPNPFDTHDTCQGCPKCKNINTVLYACDYKDCWKPITNGTPKEDGYTLTCSKHRPSLISMEG